MIPFKVVPLGSHTPPETFPLPVAVLKVSALSWPVTTFWLLSTVPK
jgi:hypothetical protein